MTDDMEAECALCHRRLPLAELKPLSALAIGSGKAVPRELAGLPPDALICVEDRAMLRRRHMEALLEAERGELGSLDREVLASLDSGGTIAEDVEAVLEERSGFGARAADAVAAFGGSWPFILIFCAGIAVWMTINVSEARAGAPFDPYPFILLNLVLSCVAALQAPVIMMSQRRQESRDRLRAENDYKVNLKAELEIRHLHDKIDHQLQQQWERLAEIQRVQLELLEEMADDPKR